MNEDKRIVLISGSPKADQKLSSSDVLINMQEEVLKASGFSIYKANIRQSLSRNRQIEDFKMISQADAMIVAFPLYIFCVPGMVMRYLQDYDQYVREQGKNTKSLRIYAFVNCGFTEIDINEEALRVIRSFSRQIGAKFRFGVSIGGGEMIHASIDEPFMKNTLSELNQAFQRIKQDITEEEPGAVADIMVPVTIPRELFYDAGTEGWYQSARLNNLEKEDLFRQPYYQETK